MPMRRNWYPSLTYLICSDMITVVIFSFAIPACAQYINRQAIDDLGGPRDSVRQSFTASLTVENAEDYKSGSIA